MSNFIFIVLKATYLFGNRFYWLKLSTSNIIGQISFVIWDQMWSKKVESVLRLIFFIVPINLFLCIKPFDKNKWGGGLLISLSV